jgi:hypothetical protein
MSTTLAVFFETCAIRPRIPHRTPIGVPSLAVSCLICQPGGCYQSMRGQTTFRCCPSARRLVQTMPRANTSTRLESRTSLVPWMASPRSRK